MYHLIATHAHEVDKSPELPSVCSTWQAPSATRMDVYWCNNMLLISISLWIIVSSMFSFSVHVWISLIKCFMTFPPILKLSFLFYYYQSLKASISFKSKCFAKFSCSYSSLSTLVLSIVLSTTQLNMNEVPTVSSCPFDHVLVFPLRRSFLGWQRKLDNSRTKLSCNVSSRLAGQLIKTLPQH